MSHPSDLIIAHEEMIGILTNFDTLENKTNLDFEPYITAFANWLEAVTEGFYIRDLDAIAFIIDGIANLGKLKYDLFKSTFDGLFAIASKPLMELKANERLSHSGREKILNFYFKLSSVWSMLDIIRKISLAKCFRCILNGGKDPYKKYDQQIQSDVTEILKQNVTDKNLIQKLVGESGAIEIIVSEYLLACDILNYNAPNVSNQNEFNQYSIDDSQVGYNQPKNESYLSPDVMNENDIVNQQDNRADTNKWSEEIKIDMDRNGDDFLSEPNSPNNDNMFKNNEVIIDSYNNDEELQNAVPNVGNDSPSKSQPEKISLSRELSQALLDLCFDLSTNSSNATLLCLLRVCDGCITLIDKDANFNSKDKRISFTVELMWNILESFLENTRKIPNINIIEALNETDVIDFERSIYVLQAILNQRLIEGFKLSDKESRNEVLIVLSMIAQFPASIPYFYESKLINLLLTYCCIEDLGTVSWNEYVPLVANSRNFVTSSEVDLEFKKELWLILSEILKHGENDDILSVISSSPIFEDMFLYIEYDTFDQGYKKSSINQENSHMLSTTSLQNNQMKTGNKTLLSKSAPIKSTLNNNNNTLNQTIQTNLTNESNQQFSGTKQKLISSLPITKAREFQLLAITFLVHNAPKMLDAFESFDGIPKIIDICMKYLTSDINEHVLLVFHGLVLLNRCLKSSSIGIQHFMEQNNSIQNFLHIFEKSTHDETRAQALRLIATLCQQKISTDSEIIALIISKNITCQQQFKAVGGITSLIKPLADYVTNRKPLVGTKAGVKLTIIGGDDLQDPLESPYGGDISIIIVSILDCLMKTLIGYHHNEATFADQEGIDCLLDLLEVSPFVLRVQVLRLVSNLSHNHQLLSFINAWRSPKTLRSAAQLLCHCWLDEEKRLDGLRDQGIIKNIYNPLGTDKNAENLIKNNIDDSVSLDSSKMINNQIENVLINSNSTETVKSIAVSKLANAILAGRNATQTNLPVEVCDKVLSKDSRVIIASTLKKLGVFEMYHITSGNIDIDSNQNHENGLTEEKTISQPSSPMKNQSMISYESSNSIARGISSTGDLGLNPSDRQVLSMAKSYEALREGEWWREVRENIISANITPIEADQALMDIRLNYSLNISQYVQMEQIELFDEDQQIKKGEEDNFIGHIINKKNQQIKAEWLKMHSKNKTQMNPFNKKKN
eukprot:gene11849-15855_t